MPRRRTLTGQVERRQRRQNYLATNANRKCDSRTETTDTFKCAFSLIPGIFAAAQRVSNSKEESAIDGSKDSGRSSSASNKRKRTSATPVAANKRRRQDSEKSESDNESVSSASSFPSEQMITGFDKGLEAEKILGSLKTNGRIKFLVRFKGAEEEEVIPSEIANIKIPQLVIEYYEERLSWYSESED